MNRDEVPSVNPKLDSMCEMLKTIHNLSERNKILEKENAELKRRDCWKGCLYASGKSELIYEYLQQRYNLTKAKELIRELLNYDIILIDGTRKLEYMDLQKKAETFLDSEVEK